MRSDERKPRVLTAVSPRAAQRVERILEGVPLERARTLGELAHALGCESFDIVVVGTHFDGSRAIEALNLVRRLCPGIALVCVRAVRFCNPLGEATLAAVHAAAREVGSDRFIDLLPLPDDEHGNGHARRLILSTWRGSANPGRARSYARRVRGGA